MEDVETRLKRSPTLPKYDIFIKPILGFIKPILG